MADASRSLGSCVCIVENFPNIEEHDLNVAVIQYFRSKDYHMVISRYVEHVMNGGSTIGKRIFPTFEDGHMAALMPPVGMTNIRLPVYNRVEGAVFAPEHTPTCGGNLFGNHNTLAKYRMSLVDVRKWLLVLGDYMCDGVADDAHMQDCQWIGFLWFGEP